MPTISEAFPSRFLSYKTFEPNQIHTVTITHVQLDSATARPQFGSARPSQQYEASWLVYFREFTLPMKLKKSKAQKIAAALGTEELLAWPGKRINIYRGMIQIGGENVEGLLIDDRPVIAAPPTTALAVTGVPAFDLASIGQKNAERFLAAMREQDATTDHFMSWLKAKDWSVYERLTGKAVDDYPRGAIPFMQKFLREFNTPPLAPGSAIGKEPPDDDIPF